MTKNEILQVVEKTKVKVEADCLKLRQLADTLGIYINLSEDRELAKRLRKMFHIYDLSISEYCGVDRVADAIFKQQESECHRKQMDLRIVEVYEEKKQFKSKNTDVYYIKRILNGNIIVVKQYKESVIWGLDDISWEEFLKILNFTNENTNNILKFITREIIDEYAECIKDKSYNKYNIIWELKVRNNLPNSDDLNYYLIQKTVKGEK